MEKSESISLRGLSLQQAALVAGFAYLLNPVPFAQIYALPRLIVDDASQTVANMAAHPHLFATAVLSLLFSALGDIIMAWALYVLLAPINRALSLLASLLQLVYAAVWLTAISQLGLLYRLVVLSDYAKQVRATDLPLQATELLGGYRSGLGIGLILFGLHLVVIGWLIAHSTYLPRWLGWLLFLDGWVWVADNLSIYLFPQASVGYLKGLWAAELIFEVWLLGWGWRIREPTSERRQFATGTCSSPDE